MNLASRRIESEITEGVFIEPNGEVRDRLDKLHALGFKLAMDDFGTGFSNLSYLRSLPFDILKIDRTFISAPKFDTEIVRAITTLAVSFGKTVVGEGVETPDQEASLMELGCHEAQGYLYSPALSTSELEAYYSGLMTSDFRKVLI